MNLEEARNNIGAEVELDESTKPYTFIYDGDYSEKGNIPVDGVYFTIKDIRDNENVLISGFDYEDIVHPRHLKLKPQNYKIHVPTEKESREAQELFFELGYEWLRIGKHVSYVKFPYLYASTDAGLEYDGIGKNEAFNSYSDKQITLQDLRDMVAKNKQTQTIQEGIKPIVDGLETSVAIQDFDSNSDEDKTVRVTGLFQDFEPRKEMTWEDALRAVADDRKVEFYNELCEQWWDISHLSATEVVRIEKFRIAPKYIYLHGNYTKEELLKEIGEIE